MRHLRTALAGLALAGCAGADISHPDAPTVSRNAVLWGRVNDASGACIPGAVALIVRGLAAGQAKAAECAGEYLEGQFVFTGLTPDVEMTIRVSAPGYSSLEQTVMPSGTSSVGTLLFTLAKN